MMLDTQKRKTLGTESVSNTNMEVDDEENRISDELLEVVDNSFSVTGFLRKVMAAEVGEDGGRAHKLIVIAVHAVMLESGFAGVDEKANEWDWPSGLFSMSLLYTLPEAESEAMKTVVLKFQNVGNYLIVYGQLGKRGTHTHCVRLKEDELVPFLNLVWANCGVMESVTKPDGSETSPEKEVLKFWRSVKDNLALPLTIDFCEEAGLVLPPCFMRLPTELKLKILESLGGADVAKVSCVSSNLRHLASSDELWKMKFGEEFRNEKKGRRVSWKKAFSMAWIRRVRGSPSCPALALAPYWHEPSRWYMYMYMYIIINPNPPLIMWLPRFAPHLNHMFPRISPR